MFSPQKECAVLHRYRFLSEFEVVWNPCHFDYLTVLDQIHWILKKLVPIDVETESHTRGRHFIPTLRLIESNTRNRKWSHAQSDTNKRLTLGQNPGNVIRSIGLILMIKIFHLDYLCASDYYWREVFYPVIEWGKTGTGSPSFVYQ